MQQIKFGLIVVAVIWGIWANAVFASSQVTNFGFVPGPLWFSKYPFFAGDKIRIYTAIYNSSGYDLEGQVGFYSNEQLIKKVDFSLAHGTAVRDVWIDWVAPRGQQTITAKITALRISSPEEGGWQPVELSSKQVAKQEIFVDGDNDNDGEGDIEDKDDDNDGFLDLDEVRAGTNPLSADSHPPLSAPTSDKATSSLKQAKEKISQKTNQIKGYWQLIKSLPSEWGQTVSQLTDRQKVYLEKKIEDTQKQIISLALPPTASSSATSGNNVWPNPAQADKIAKKTQLIKNLQRGWRQLMVWGLKATVFLLEHKIFLYLVLVLVIYKILHFIVGLFLY